LLNVLLLVRLLNTSPAAGGIFINGEWQETQLTSRPEAYQVVFDGLDQLSKARGCFSVWRAIEEIRKEKPVFPEKAFARLARARETDSPVTLFVPWGINPEWIETAEDINLNSPEAEVLGRIKAFQELLAANRIKSQVLLMPADLYATEVNNFDSSVANSYMEWLKYLADKFGYETKPWSEIRQENQTEYDRLRQKITLERIEANDELRARLSKAYLTAKKRSGYETWGQQKEAALAYVTERLCEAVIVEEKYQPIKVSCVEPGKDGPLDGEIPRLYLIPDSLRFPWLKGGIK
jgi:hypothetical protein